MGHRTIKQKLKRVRTRGRAIQILTEWTESYEGQMLYIVRGMEKAKKRADLPALGCYIHELSGLQDKLFRGIRAISKELVQPDGPLDPDDPTPLWEDDD